jgi:RNA polymerase subunit RPABC4/transcription elongation factor Spt4
MKKKACKTCRMLVDEGQQCPICKKDNMSNSWQGRIYFLNPGKSVVAHKMSVEEKGEYAIKVR